MYPIASNFPLFWLETTLLQLYHALRGVLHLVHMWQLYMRDFSHSTGVLLVVV